VTQRALLFSLLVFSFSASWAEDDIITNGKDVPYWPTTEPIVEASLKLAKVTEGDTVYDLGSGDGRIVIAAARDFGATGVGIEYEPELIELSTRNADEAGVAERVRFIEEDFFESDLGEATVVVLYLSRKVNRELKEQLTEQLAPGSRVVTHTFEIPGWDPTERIRVAGRNIYLYVMP
jgi:precorrin-6B methylase 2